MLSVAGRTGLPLDMGGLPRAFCSVVLVRSASELSLEAVWLPSDVQHGQAPAQSVGELA